MVRLAAVTYSCGCPPLHSPVQPAAVQSSRARTERPTVLAEALAAIRRHEGPFHSSTSRLSILAERSKPSDEVVEATGNTSIVVRLLRRRVVVVNPCQDGVGEVTVLPSELNPGDDVAEPHRLTLRKAATPPSYSLQRGSHGDAACPIMERMKDACWRR